MKRVKLEDYLIDKHVTKGPRKCGRLENNITVKFGIGGGVKTNYRKVDYVHVPFYKGDDSRNRIIYKEQIIDICYDPHLTAYLALVVGKLSDKYRLILAAEGQKSGDIFNVSRGPPETLTKFNLGDRFPVKYFPIGTAVFNIERFLGEGGAICRSAGTSVIVTERYFKNGRIMVLLEGIKKKRKVIVEGDCLASYGNTSNQINNKRVWGKAGRKKLKNIRSRGLRGKEKHYKRKLRYRTYYQRLDIAMKSVYHTRTFKRLPWEEHL